MRTTPAPPPPGPAPPPTDHTHQLHLLVHGLVEDELRARLSHLVLTAARDDAERTTGSWTPRHCSTSAMTTDQWALRTLVESLEQGQADGSLPPLAYRAFTCPPWTQYGTVVMHTPDLGTFEGRCDSQGDVVLTDRQVATALAGPSETGAAEALSRLAGLPWSTHLDVLDVPAGADVAGR